MTEIKYITLKNNYDDYFDRIVNFYKPKYKKTFNKITVLNSAIVCLVMADSEIIGAVRALSDLSRHGIIVDLMIDERFRRQAIGSTLLKNITQKLVESNVANISLTTEPNSPWLVAFYEKNGFEIVEGSVHMKFVEE